MKERVDLAKAHRLLSPRPLCLLTTRYRDQVNVATLGWVGPVSLDPPLVIIPIHPSRYSHDLLMRAEECVLNIPGRPLAEQTIRCGADSGRDADKLVLTGLTAVDSQAVEVPSIDECLANIECAVIDAYKPGDHTLFVAQIIDACVETEAFREQWLLTHEEVSPLFHIGGLKMALLEKPWTVSPDPAGESA